MANALALRLVAALTLASAVAQAHGGVPISSTIIFQGETLVVPTIYWGVFLGQDGGAWRWICEEAINKNQSRRWALQGNGTYHVTDYGGITSSRDKGCTWVASTGEIATRQTSMVVADPADPGRAWATTEQGTAAPWNALFTTIDGGVTWTTALQADEYLRGVTISSDGQRLYVVGASRQATGPIVLTLHASSDAGATWTAVPIDYSPTDPTQTPSVVEPIAIDPVDGSVYMRDDLEPMSSLLRVTTVGATTVLLSVPAGTRPQPAIAAIEFDVARQEMLVATRSGLYKSVAGGALTKTSSLSQAQCVTHHDQHLYACAWNYPPDNAAIARSDDDGATFQSVFQYDQTVGPVEFCGASTPVAQTCPGVWQMYADQLGIGLSTGSDGGSVDAAGVTPPAPSPNCHACAVGARSPGSPPLVGSLLPLLLLAVVLRGARRLVKNGRAGARPPPLASTGDRHFHW